MHRYIYNYTVCRCIVQVNRVCKYMSIIQVSSAYICIIHVSSVQISSAQGSTVHGCSERGVVYRYVVIGE